MSTGFSEPLGGMLWKPPLSVEDEVLRGLMERIYGRAGRGSASLVNVSWYPPGTLTQNWAQGDENRTISAQICDAFGPHWLHEGGHMLHLAHWPRRSQVVPMHRAEAVAQFTVYCAFDLRIVNWDVFQAYSERYRAMNEMHRRADSIAMAAHYDTVTMRQEDCFRAARDIFFGRYD